MSVQNKVIKGQYGEDSCHPGVGGWLTYGHYEWGYQGSGKNIILDKWFVAIDLGQPDRKEALCMIATIT